MLQGPWMQVGSCSIVIISSSVLYCFQRNRNNHSDKHTQKILRTPKLTNVSFLPKPPISQSPGKQLKHQARKTCYFSGQALTSLPTKHSPTGHFPHMGRLRLPSHAGNQWLAVDACGDGGQDLSACALKSKFIYPRASFHAPVLTPKPTPQCLSHW